MICRKCGELLNENAKICPICGAGQIFDSTTKLNPTHTYAEDCAHEEEHRPRKRRTRVRFRFSRVLLIPVLFFVMPVLLASRLVQLGHNIITIIVVALFIVTIIASITNTLRK